MESLQNAVPTCVIWNKIELSLRIRDHRIISCCSHKSTLLDISMPLLRLLVLLLHLAAINSFAETTKDPSSQSCAMSSSKFRSVRKILPKPSAHWVGDGFKVFPVFGNLAFTEEISPLLMFDYAEPRKFPGRVGLGVGSHPHRGFETVTLAFQGEVEHHDSTGKTGIIGAGDVQWMTAGRGIIHEEYHSKEFTKSGGTFEFCQLWVNLPKKNKMSKPGYQALQGKNFPVVNLPLNAEADSVLGTARIIAGELGEIKGTAKTFSPVQMWDVNLPNAGSEIDLPFPPDHNCIIFVRRGSVEILSGEKDDKLKGQKLGPQDVALMRIDGSDILRIRVTESDSSIMILGGEPLNEPIAAQGPFVMNTKDEIHKAMADFRAGKMGK
jgi:redox-sensitive bicupin YhaK (pirin superfamily)